MSSNEMSMMIVAWWGAGLSTILGGVKLWELWRGRFQLEVTGRFSSSGHEGNETIIRNLTARPVILKHWEIVYRSGNPLSRAFEECESADPDDGDRRIEADSTLVLKFVGANHFEWRERFLGPKSTIHVRLHVAGRRPILRLVHPFKRWKPRKPSPVDRLANRMS